MKGLHAKKGPRTIQETKLQEWAFACLRLLGRDDCMAFHPPNEGARSKATGAALLRQGMLPGIPDIVVLRRGGRVALMELKVGKRRLTEEQRKIKMWCIANGVPHAVCRTPEQIFAQFQKWEMLRDGVSMGAVPTPELALKRAA